MCGNRRVDMHGRGVNVCGLRGSVWPCVAVCGRSVFLVLVSPFGVVRRMGVACVRHGRQTVPRVLALPSDDHRCSIARSK